MNMAKASTREIDTSLRLCGILEDIERDQYPRDINGDFADTDPDTFDPDDGDHLRAFYDRIKGVLDKMPGGIGRVIWGFHTIMNNNIVDPDQDILSLHPRLSTGQLEHIITTCTDITKAHGFDVTHHRTQLCLMVTEIAEALEHVSSADESNTDDFARYIECLSQGFEHYRALLKGPHTDRSLRLSHAGLMEELADVVIRIASYVGGNGDTADFVKALHAKREGVLNV